ncbi:hypothetical protein CRUP_021404, partial [Coryphaenoides rupestris]
MREVDLGSGRALLIKEHGEFSAIAHKCPHYGAPLVRVEKDKVIIRANKQALQAQKRCKPMSRCSAVINSNTRFSHVLIIG